MDKKINIVIIDDNRSTSSIIKENLIMEYVEHGYEVKVSIFDTINGIVDKTIIDADFLLMDYNLEEDINGITLAEKLINKGFKGKVILITGEGGMIVKTKVKFSSIKKDRITYLEKNESLLDKIIDIIDETIK